MSFRMWLFGWLCILLCCSGSCIVLYCTVKSFVMQQQSDFMTTMYCTVVKKAFLQEEMAVEVIGMAMLVLYCTSCVS